MSHQITMSDFPENLKVPRNNEGGKEEELDDSDLAKDLILIGIVGIEDPLRKEVPGMKILRFPDRVSS
jgi:magnesium-transporting ATPase (P-type)